MQGSRALGERISGATCNAAGAMQRHHLLPAAAAAASASLIAAMEDSSTYAQWVQWAPPCSSRRSPRGGRAAAGWAAAATAAHIVQAARVQTVQGCAAALVLHQYSSSRAAAHLAVHNVGCPDRPVCTELRSAAIDKGAISKDHLAAIARGDAYRARRASRGVIVSGSAQIGKALIDAAASAAAGCRCLPLPAASAALLLLLLLLPLPLPPPLLQAASAAAAAGCCWLQLLLAGLPAAAHLARVRCRNRWGSTFAPRGRRPPCAPCCPARQLHARWGWGVEWAGSMGDMAYVSWHGTEGTHAPVRRCSAGARPHRPPPMSAQQQLPAAKQGLEESSPVMKHHGVQGPGAGMTL